MTKPSPAALARIAALSDAAFAFAMLGAEGHATEAEVAAAMRGVERRTRAILAADRLVRVA